MDTITTFCIFIIVLFLYIHVMSQFKKSEDLEIYEMDYTNNPNLQDVCDVRQPVLFNVRDIIPGLFSDLNAQNIAKYSSHDVRLKDSRDYYSDISNEQIPVDSITLALHTTIHILENDKTGCYFSEDNEDFLEESGIGKRIQAIDDLLRPNFTVHSSYDILFGSPNTTTPLRYHTNCRQFLCVTSGKIRVKMTPWKSSKYLHPYKDYEHYEFRSLVHPTHPSKCYMSDFEKTNFIDFEVNEGTTLYVPPYWWYSIIYLDDPSTFVCKTTYSTLMNSLSNLPDLTLYILQQQNITKKINKIPDISKNIIDDDIKTEQNDSLNDLPTDRPTDLPTDPEKKNEIIESASIQKELEQTCNNINFTISDK